MKNNEEEIREICRKEDNVLATKAWLRILFFLAAVVVAIVYYKALSAPMTDHGKTAVETICITLSIFASLLIAGYFYDKLLSKKLNGLWKQKKLLF